MPNDVNYDNLSLGHRGIQNQLGTDGSLSVYNGLGRRTFYVQAQALQISGTPSNEQVSLDCPLTVSNSVTVSGPLTVGADASTGEGGVCITGDQGGALELGNSKSSGTKPYLDFHYGVGSAQNYNMRISNSGDRKLAILGGKVGIGTTNPGVTLEVKTASNNSIDGIRAIAPNGSYVLLRPHMGQCSNNGIVQAGDAGIIFTQGSKGTGAFAIAPWADATSGLRIDSSGNLTVAEGGAIQWGSNSRLNPDQGGSIELGGYGTPGQGTPYIDFHYSGLSQDYNTRIINDADGRLTIDAKTVFVSGNIETPGDIILSGADCAEEFGVAHDQTIEAGMVMVIDHDSLLKSSDQAYDKRVAGVISGAGDLKPGITLGKQQGNKRRLPLALVGKVYCKADAQFGPIEVGDLLTTSPTPGHAMKASDPAKAFGAVIGKALGSLAAGTGLIPIIVALA